MGPVILLHRGADWQWIDQWDACRFWLAIEPLWKTQDHPWLCINMAADRLVPIITTTMARRKRKLTFSSKRQKRQRTARFPCVVCKQEVLDKHPALSCDGCERWQHLECNSGTTSGIFVIRSPTCIHTHTHTHLCVCVCVIQTISTSLIKQLKIHYPVPLFPFMTIMTVIKKNCSYY